jgi:hypothetical protein
MDFELVASLVLACLVTAPRGSVVHVASDGSLRVDDPDRPRSRGTESLAFARVGSLPSVEAIAARLERGAIHRPDAFHPYRRPRRASRP